jgi:hypothetical protein
MRQALERAANPSLVNPIYRLRMPDERVLRDAFVEAIRPALTGKTSAEDALKQAAQRWQEVSPNRETRLKDYRQSVGLN